MLCLQKLSNVFKTANTFVINNMDVTKHSMLIACFHDKVLFKRIEWLRNRLVTIMHSMLSEYSQQSKKKIRSLLGLTDFLGQIRPNDCLLESIYPSWTQLKPLGLNGVILDLGTSEAQLKLQAGRQAEPNKQLQQQEGNKTVTQVTENQNDRQQDRQTAKLRIIKQCNLAKASAA